MSRLRSLGLQKSPSQKSGNMCQDSYDISKGLFRSGICEFEFSEASQPFLGSENFLFLIRKARQMRAFLIAKIFETDVRDFWLENSQKSPDKLNKTPVFRDWLQRH